MRQPTQSRPVLPVGLLTESKPALVIGGGKVALRKTRLLLEASAQVTVVSPDVSPNLAALAAEGAIRHLSREFAEEDITGAFIVFAATNDKPLNRRVIDACRERGVLCCSVDANWPDADFLTPAILRRKNLTIAISTGGRSCRRSRMLRESFERHIASVETAGLLVAGTSHNYLSVEQREPYQLVGRRLEQTGRMLMSVWGIHEFMLLNTCNRVELIAAVTSGADLDEVIQRIMGFDHLEPDEFYVKRDEAAFAHTTLTCAGLLSQAPGEHHIVAQVKDTLEHSVRSEWAGGLMQEWLASALHVSKEIRQVTKGLLHDFEIEDLCVNYLAAECAEFDRRRVMVLGAGAVSRGLVQRLLARGLPCLWCYHVNKPDLPAAWARKVRLCTFNDLRDRLGEADVIVCATGGEGHVLHQGHAPFFDQEADILLVDLAMPRNIAPKLNGLTSNLRVVDLDGLKYWGRRETVDMAKVYELSQQVIQDHREFYEKIMRSFQGGNSGE